jgi:hypothetical protein
MLDDLKKFKSLKTAMPVLKPLLQRLGVDVHQMQEAFINFDELERQAQESAVLLEKFNDFFSVRGWIIYDSMKLDVAKLPLKRQSQAMSMAPRRISLNITVRKL